MEGCARGTVPWLQWWAFKDDQVKAICHQISTALNIVAPANFNSLGQIVIAGHEENRRLLLRRKWA